MMFQRHHSSRALAAVLLAGASLLTAQACRGSRQLTDAERLAKGRDIIERMSKTLAAAPALSVTTLEVRDGVKSNGDKRQVTVTRQTTMRRPDRLYFKTSGDLENEGFYDGVGLTFVIHKDKLYGQARMPETLDRALDAINERYDVRLPVADFLYSSPSKALLTDTTTGGWVGQESLGGKSCDHLAFKDQGVSWELWVAATGDPLPVRGTAAFPQGKRVKGADLTFSNWNLSPQIDATLFDPKVPSDYEGIAIIQRAAVLANAPGGEGTTGKEDKK